MSARNSLILCSLVLEAGDKTWAGSRPGCATYYFIMGLSHVTPGRVIM